MLRSKMDNHFLFATTKQIEPSKCVIWSVYATVKDGQSIFIVEIKRLNIQYNVQPAFDLAWFQIYPKNKYVKSYKDGKLHQRMKVSLLTAYCNLIPFILDPSWITRYMLQSPRVHLPQQSVIKKLQVSF